MPKLPDISPVARILRALHDRFTLLTEGEVATYIPELGRADPSWFGISVATADGHVYEVGDTRQTFSIQSISKPFVYGLALEDRGKAAVLDRVGVEPTGDAFNEISLESPSGRPRNPMINAGAMTTTSLIAGDSAEERWVRLSALFEMYAGRALSLDESVYLSERHTGHRNRAISHMLRNFNIIEHDPEPDLDLYFRQCSIEVDCRDLSVMGATLATGGVNPITGQRVLRSDHVDEVLSVMTTCGMYDYAGEWVYRVGLPAKSGVSGGIVAIMPGQLAIGAFSPRLDDRGNSVRGVAVCEALSEQLGLHFLRAPRPSVATVRSRASIANISSRRARFASERGVLTEHGDQGIIYQFQGELSFAGAEAVIRRLASEPHLVSHLVLDFTRTSSVDVPSERLLLELFASLGAQGRALAFVGLTRHSRLLRALEESRSRKADLRIRVFEELDLAVEWCEDEVLSAHGAVTELTDEMPLSKYDLMLDLEPAQIDLLMKRMTRRTFRAREFVVRKGEPADELFLLVQGRLSVLADTPDGRLQRLAALSAGMSFGESGMLAGANRSAYVRADSPSVCWTLHRSAFANLASSHPDVRTRILENLLRSTSNTLNRFSSDVIAGLS